MSSTPAWAMGIPLKKKNWQTQQSFFCKTILDAAKKRVCPLVDSFAVCLRRDYPFSLKSLRRRDFWSSVPLRSTNGSGVEKGNRRRSTSWVLRTSA